MTNSNSARVALAALYEDVEQAIGNAIDLGQTTREVARAAVHRCLVAEVVTLELAPSAERQSWRMYAAAGLASLNLATSSKEAAVIAAACADRMLAAERERFPNG
jgi:hypothetical protein